MCAQANAAQAQTTRGPQSQSDLRKVKPNISGQRNGVFIEPDAMDFADHAGYVSLFDGKTLTGWDGSRACGAWKTAPLWAFPRKEHVGGQLISCVSRRGGEGFRPEARDQGGVGRRQRRAIPQQHGHSAGTYRPARASRRSIRAG